MSRRNVEVVREAIDALQEANQRGELTPRLAAIWTVRAGQIVYVDVYGDDQDALEAARLPG